MTWQDFLYTKGITEQDLTPEQLHYWQEAWKHAYPPAPDKLVVNDIQKEPVLAVFDDDQKDGPVPEIRS